MLANLSAYFIEKEIYNMYRYKGTEIDRDGERDGGGVFELCERSVGHDRVT